MKKLIMPIMALATIFASFINIQNLSNRRINKNYWIYYQFRVVINNFTNNVGIMAVDSFYLDLSVNGVVVNDDDFTNIRKYPENYNDTFVTEPGTSEIIYTKLIDFGSDARNFTINFNFGILYWVLGIWYHSQIATSGGFVQKNLEDNLIRHNCNGLELFFGVFGGQGTNTGTQKYNLYNFVKID